jgi:FkbH-like protein
VVWDLDHTLWDGILSESADVQLRPGIVKIIEELDDRGILHSIASKNNYTDVIKKLTQFGLESYFLYPQINWNAKSSSISAIQKKLNFALDTFLFIDDQPFERDEVKAMHPDVECIDAAAYETLLSYSRLQPRFITEDSKKRRLMYQADQHRNQEEEAFVGTPNDFLASLQMEFIISDAKEEDLKRAEELTVRTHQLNATGVTYNYDELNHFRLSRNYKLLVCELTDKYGSYGKIGLSLIEITDEYYHVKLLLMSCRVMSRGVGTVLLTHIMNNAKAAGKKLRADFKITDRNRQMYITYCFNNFKEIQKGEDGIILFENDLSQIQPFPDYINVNIIKSGTEEMLPLRLS